MKQNDTRFAVGVGKFFSAVGEILVEMGRAVLSALAYIIAGMIVGGAGGGGLGLYYGLGLFPAVLIGAILGLVFVVAVQVMFISGSGW